MRVSPNWAYGLSSLLFAMFVANMLLAKSGEVILGSAGEMVLLAAACAWFGIGTLISEAKDTR